MEFDSTLFNPFENRFQIPWYHIMWMSLIGRVVDCLGYFAHYYINIEHIEFVPKNSQRLALSFDSAKYIHAMEDSLKSLLQLPDKAVDIIIDYLSSMMEIVTQEEKTQITVMFLNSEWYSKHRLSQRAKRIWRFGYNFCCIWFIYRALLSIASFIILMYEYFLMTSSYSSWDRFVLFVWILGYFHPFMPRAWGYTPIFDSGGYSLFSYGPIPRSIVTVKRGSLYLRSAESLAFTLLMICLSWGSVWSAIAFFPFILPGIIYCPLVIGYVAGVFSIMWVAFWVQKRSCITESICYAITESICLALYVMLLYPLFFVWFNMISTASLYCFYKTGKYWECVLDSFYIQHNFVSPQAEDWRLIVVLLAMIF
eukprot:157618_1